MGTSRRGIPLHGQYLRTWEDMAYESIPRVDWITRVFWHACRLLAEAKKARTPLAAHQAYLDAEALVHDEDTGAPLLHARSRYPS
jgi:hypothetical protein